MLVRSPRAAELAGLLTARGATVTPQPDGALVVTGLDAAAIGDLAAEPRHRRARAGAAAGLPRGRLPGPHRRKSRLPTAARRGRGSPDERPSRFRVRARDLLGSEWTKFRSVRSTYWTLAVAVVTPIGFSILVGFRLRGRAGRAAPVDPLLPGLLSLEYAVIAVTVLGVLSFSSEFGTGLIRTTFAAAPRRRAVLAAKAAVRAR